MINDFLIELLAVVAGILIAFQLDRWNEKRRGEQRKKRHLLRLQNDIQQDLKEIDRVRDVALKRLGHVQLLTRVIDNPALIETDPLEFLTALSQASSRMSFYPKDFTFREIQSSGDIMLFDEDLSAQLFNYYNSLSFSEQFTSYVEMVQEEALKRFAGILKPEQWYLNRLGLLESLPEDLKPEETTTLNDAWEAFERFRSNEAAQQWLRLMATAQATNFGRTTTHRENAQRLLTAIETEVP